jgi:hypothetical protein
MGNIAGKYGDWEENDGDITESANVEPSAEMAVEEQAQPVQEKVEKPSPPKRGGSGVKRKRSDSKIEAEKDAGKEPEAEKQKPRNARRASSAVSETKPTTPKRQTSRGKSVESIAVEEPKEEAKEEAVEESREEEPKAKKARGPRASSVPVPTASIEKSVDKPVIILDQNNYSNLSKDELSAAPRRSMRAGKTPMKEEKARASPSKAQTPKSTRGAKSAVKSGKREEVAESPSPKRKLFGTPSRDSSPRSSRGKTGKK